MYISRKPHRKTGSASSRSLLATSHTDKPLLHLLQNKAIRELFEKHEVLEHTFVEMAHEVIRTAPWGLLWR